MPEERFGGGHHGAAGGVRRGLPGQSVHYGLPIFEVGSEAVRGKRAG
jgi:hypothetical protein